MNRRTKQKGKRAVVSLLLAGILFSESFFVQNGFSITTRAAEMFGTETQENVSEQLRPSETPEGSENPELSEKPEGSEQSDNTVETPDESGEETIEGEQDEVESKDKSEEIDIMLPDESDEETQPVVTEDIDSSVSIGEFAMELKDGASSGENGYVWKPTSTVSGHSFIYELRYSVAGEYAPGKRTFEIELPLHILKDRDGNGADSFECPYPAASEITEEDGQDVELVYEIDEERQKIVIYNYKDMTAGEAGFIELAYTTTKSTMDYVDEQPSEKVEAILTVKGKEGDDVTKSADASSLIIDTQAGFSSVQKLTPSYFSSWQDGWGEKPEDAEKYYYLVWPVRTALYYKTTAPYDLELADTFSDLSGNVVGYRFAGQTSYTSTTKAENLRSTGDRYDYVLTRHSKEEADQILETEDSYTVNNKVQVTLHESDHRDAEGQTASSSCSYTYRKPKYTPPTFAVDGSFRLYKEGSSSSYRMGELRSGAIDSIDKLAYRTYIMSYAYPWTLEDGCTGTVEDAKNDRFGKKKVTYTFTDDTLTLENERLNNEDYNITGLAWGASFSGAKFNEDTLRFEIKSINNYQPEDALTFWTRMEDQDWKKAAVYDISTDSYQDVDPGMVTAVTGRKLDFAEGVKGVRITCENAYYTTRLEMAPTVSLKGTEHVLTLLGQKTKAVLTNTADSKVTQGDTSIYSRRESGRDYLYQVTATSDMRKSIIQTSNDKRRSRFLITWRTGVSESYRDDEGYHAIGQQSGIFYDLLPTGSILVPGSVSVTAAGQKLVEGTYAVEQTENYKDSGRTLLKVKIRESSDSGYQVTYQTAHAYNAVLDYGKDQLNSVAYETGNEGIASGVEDTGGKITDAELMKGLNPESAGKKFLYAEARYNISVLMAGNTGLTKQVKNQDTDTYSYEATVGQSGAYSYQLRLANDSVTSSKDIIFYDSLESFFRTADQTEEVRRSDWKGTLTGIDVSALRKAGILPVVYLSKQDRLNVAAHHDLGEQLNGEPVWIEYSKFVQQYGLEAAHAVAIDASRKTDKSDFVLGVKKSLSITLYMKAPDSDRTDKEDPMAFNNVFVERTAIRGSGEEEVQLYQFYHQDYTKLHYRINGGIELKKVDQADMETAVQGAVYLLRGTSDYGTEYALSRETDRDGYFSYEKIEKGTYELVETSCTDDWLVNTEVYTVIVDGEGNVSAPGLMQDEDGRYLVPDKERIHGELFFEKRNQVTHEAVNGVGFLLTGTSDYGTDVSMYQESEGTTVGGGEAGEVRFTNLELGTYTLVEQKTVEGYILSRTTWSVEINEQGRAVLRDEDGQEVTKKDSLYQIENEPLHSIRFIKSSTYGENIYLQGAEFKLTGISDYGTSVDKNAVSDTDGLVVIDGLESGTYLLKETQAPAEHELNPTTYTVKVKPDDTFEIDGLQKTTYAGAEIYNFINVKTTGLVKLTKIWKDDSSNEERAIPDMTISTEMPSRNPNGYTLIFDANGGKFSDQTTEKERVYAENGSFIGGSDYEEPVKTDCEFLGWYTKATGGRKYTLNASHDPVNRLTGDLTLYAQYKLPIKYAVSIYGIGVDTMKGGAKGGLTFGPAMGAGYKNSYKSHTASEITKSGNLHRCVHDDDWNTIIQWNKEDPYVYEQCIKEGCTHSVALKKNNTTTLLNPAFDTSKVTGDGPGLLYNEVQINGVLENMRWQPNGVSGSPNGDNSGGWGRSRIRAILNGANSDTITTIYPYGGHSTCTNDIHKNPTVYTSDNCLLATFPQELQNAIGEREVKYDTQYAQLNDASYLKTCYDKLWLLSTAELPESKAGYYRRPQEGTVYEKFMYSNNITIFESGYSYEPKGHESAAWLRSIPGYSKTEIVTIYTSYLSTAVTGTYYGVAPCFTLKR